MLYGIRKFSSIVIRLFRGNSSSSLYVYKMKKGDLILRIKSKSELIFRKQEIKKIQVDIRCRIVRNKKKSTRH